MQNELPILVPLTRKARTSLTDANIVALDTFPFRFGRESRIKRKHGRIVLDERRKGKALPNNDVYLLDTGRRPYVSREHFQIDRNTDGTFEVVDRGSACGTTVGALEIGGDSTIARAALCHGDVIAVGPKNSPFLFRFDVHGQLEPAAAQTHGHGSVWLALTSLSTILVTVLYYGLLF